MTQIAKSLFTGVVRHQQRYYAVTDQATVHVYEQTNEWKQHHSYSIKGSKNQIITLGITKKLLYVSFALEHRIDIFSLEGKLKSSTGKKGHGAAGELSAPRICTTDDADNVLIADRSNNRLQNLNAIRQWSFVSLQPPVESPSCACLESDTLYVNENEKKLLHAYRK